MGWKSTCVLQYPLHHFQACIRLRMLTGAGRRFFISLNWLWKLIIEKVPNFSKVCRTIFFFFLEVSPLCKELFPFETFYEPPVSSASAPANPGWPPALTQFPRICELLHKGTLWHRPGLGTGTFTTLNQVLQNKWRNMSWDFHANFSLLETPGEEFKLPLKNPFQEASL